MKFQIRKDGKDIGSSFDNFQDAVIYLCELELKDPTRYRGADIVAIRETTEEKKKEIE